MTRSCSPLHVLTPVPDALAAIDAAGRVLDVNPAAERLLGARRPEILGRPISDFLIGLPPAKRTAALPMIAGYQAAGLSLFRRRVQLTLHRPDGCEVPVDAFLTGSARTPGVYIAFIRDRTSLNALEAESRRTKEALRCVEHLATAAAWEWDPEHGGFRASASLARLIGGRPNAIEASPDLLGAFGHPADTLALRRAVDRAARDREPFALDVRLADPEGRLRYVRVAAGPPRREGGSGRLVGVVRDVTDECLADRRIRTRLAASRVLAGWRTLERSAHDLLTVIAEGLACEAATLWLPERDVLVPRVNWFAERISDSPFARITRSLKLPRGVGLPGAAWERRRPVTPPAVGDGRGHVREDAARSAGLRTAVAFPAIAAEAVVAVIDLHAPDAVEVTPQSRQALMGLGYEIGAVLPSPQERRAAGSLTPREIEILSLAADGLSVPQIAASSGIESSTVKTHLDHIYAKLGVPNRAAAVAQALRGGLID